MQLEDVMDEDDSLSILIEVVIAGVVIMVAETMVDLWLRWRWHGLDNFSATCFSVLVEGGRQFSCTTRSWNMCRIEEGEELYAYVLAFLGARMTRHGN